jgi:hypothetical protein
MATGSRSPAVVSVLRPGAVLRGRPGGTRTHSPRIKRRYADDRAVCAIVRAAEREALAAVTRGLRAVARQACATLARAVADETVLWPARIRACDVVLGHVVKLLEITEIERRLDELEQVIKGGSHAV